MWKNKKSEKSELKYYVLSTSNLNLGNNILESNKEYCIDQKTYELLKQSSFYKKWSLILTEK